MVGLRLLVLSCSGLQSSPGKRISGYRLGEPILGRLRATGSPQRCFDSLGTHRIVSSQTTGQLVSGLDNIILVAVTIRHRDKGDTEIYQLRSGKAITQERDPRS